MIAASSAVLLCAVVAGFDSTSAVAGSRQPTGGDPARSTIFDAAASTSSSDPSPGPSSPTFSPRLRGSISPPSSAVAPGHLAGQTFESGDEGSTATVSAGPVIGSDGAVNARAYRQVAASFATPEGITYRFGSPASSTSTRGRPTADRPSDKVFVTKDTNVKRDFQVGVQDSSQRDFSSDQGQVGYISTEAKPTIGVDHVQTLNLDEQTVAEKPELSWTYNGGGHPEDDFVDDEYSAGCVARLGTTFGRFVAQARAYAHGEATANTLAVFDNGVIAAAGDNTARGHACLKLPSNLHPSAISLTNGNEFALVTVWNTDTLRGELAVIALAGQQPVGALFHDDWSELYPGMWSYGVPAFAKLLGTVPLPVATPTSVSAVSDNPLGRWVSKPDGSNVLPGDFPLSNETNRQTFITGPNQDKYAKAGYAVITSRSEKKVVFVDLQPLFAGITDAYFGSRSQFTSITGNIGQRADQWPYAFSSDADSEPLVVKTVSMSQVPTAAAAMLSGAKTPRAYVATEDGTLHVFGVGGLASDADASASGVVEVGSIPVGRNPTSITYVKDRSSGEGPPAIAQDLDNTLIVTSRGDRKIQWVTLSGDSGAVSRTLKDSRLVDPIAAEDNNNHGTESYVVSVADYGAGRLFNYRYGPVIFHTQGGAVYGVGRSGKDKFEFGGAYDPKGKPFSISVTNVT